MHRMFSVPEFTGKIINGQSYIIVDDVATSGSTLKALREYIVGNGGIVVAATTLAASSTPQTGYGGHLAIKVETLNRLIEKFGEAEINSILLQYGIAKNIQGLTNSQGNYIANHSTLDRFREKIIAAGYESSNKYIENSLSESQIPGVKEFTEGFDGIKRNIDGDTLNQEAVKMVEPQFMATPKTDKAGNEIGDGTFHANYDVFEFDDYPQVQSSVSKSDTTESVYVTYYNTDNDRRITVRFSNHENNAVKFGDQLDGNWTDRNEVLAHLGCDLLSFFELTLIDTNTAYIGQYGLSVVICFRSLN